jgi:hypothetical protein
MTQDWLQHALVRVQNVVDGYEREEMPKDLREIAYRRLRCLMLAPNDMGIHDLVMVSFDQLGKRIAELGLPRQKPWDKMSAEEKEGYFQRGQLKRQATREAEDWRGRVLRHKDLVFKLDINRFGEFRKIKENWAKSEVFKELCGLLNTKLDELNDRPDDERLGLMSISLIDMIGEEIQRLGIEKTLSASPTETT